MSRSSSQVFRWSRLLPLAFGSVALACLVALDGNPIAAQTKKEAKTPAKTKDGEEAKATEPAKKRRPPYVQNIPPITDQTINSSGAKQVAKINESIRANWVANKINPSERCTDYEYLRRASLDIIGRIATEKEIAQFMGQPPATRRSWLVEHLLRNEEYAENFANIWTTMLLTRTGSQKVHQDQMRFWLNNQFAVKGGEDEDAKVEEAPAPSKNSTKGKGKVQSTATNGEADWSKIVTALLTATGKTNDKQAVNFIAHHIGEEIRQDESKKGKATDVELAESGRYDMVPVTSRTTRLFLGIRTQCVQCHDHPFNGDLQQSQFWGINAFFRQTTVSQRPGTMMAVKNNKGKLEEPQIEVTDIPNYNNKAIVSYERRSGLLKYTSMQFLDGTRVKTIPEGSSRRTELAKLITANPSFSKVFVNRTWAHFLGKSFTKDAVDDFGDHNPATNPELLDFLAEEFKAYNHNPKDLIRWICNSQAYGLSSKANMWNDESDDEVFFARMLLKSMTPEQLFDSLMTATASKISGDKAARHALREKWLDKLVLNFGNDEGEEGTFSGTVVQALMLMNGEDINQAIMDQKVGTVANVFSGSKAPTPAAFNHLYLAALNRPATAAEIAKLQDPKMYMFFNPALKGKMPGADAFAIGYYQDIFWALLNSNEFILNH